MGLNTINMDNIDVIQSVKMPIELVENNIGQIPGVKANPREMTEMEFRKLKKSLQRDAQMTAISELKLFPYNGKWIAIGGNMRLQAMKELGWKEVIAKPIPADTDAETLERYILLDNSSFGKWDFDKLANEWDAELLSSVCIDIPTMEEPELEEEAVDDNCDIEELKPKAPKSKFGDIYKLGEHILIVGDATKEEFYKALMQDNLADSIITDPPYNVNYEGGTKEELKIQNDKMDKNTFLAFLTDTFTCYYNHLKMGGSFYIWHSDSEGYNFRQALMNANLSHRQLLIWNKNSFVLGRQDYQNKHEPCLYGWKEGAAHYFTPKRNLSSVIDLENGKDIDNLSKGELQDLLKEILNLPATVIDENKPLRNGEHPTMKPIPLIGRLISNSTKRGDIVLDTFGGSGTTLIACEQLGRRCRMMELDPIYADVIINRWEQLTEEKAIYITNILDNTEKKGE